MSSTSRPHTTGTSNIQQGQGQSPGKPSQVESTANPQNVSQPSLYPNQQFIPNNIPLINSAQQLQFQTNFHQTAAFIQRQTQLLHQQQQQQQQPNSVESQLKNQQIANGPLASFHNLPDLINLLLLQSNSNLNFPLSQLNQTQAMAPVQQQPLQTPKTLPVSPTKLGQSQHTPRNTVGSPKAVTANITNTQTAEVNNTPVTPQVSEHHTGSLKPAVTSPAKSLIASTVSTPSTYSSPSSVDDVKERTNISGPAISKTDDSALNNSVTPLSDIVLDAVSSREVNKTPLPRRKQTASGISPIKANPVISPSNATGPADSLTFSTPKKSNEVTASPVTPVSNIAAIVSPTTPNTPPDKKTKANKEVTVKSVKKNELDSKAASTSEDQKPSNSQQKPSNSEQKPSQSLAPEISSIEEPVSTKRNRIRTNLYQSPTPDLVWATKMSFTEAYKNSSGSKDKLIIFYTDEFLAVRNDEGSFFLCQCLQNMYRTSKKCRVRWLNKVVNSDDTYELTFYDQIDKECILTSLELENAANNHYTLTQKERERVDNILKKSIDVEKGLLPKPEVTEENPDGLDISLYKSESQLELKAAVSPSLKRQAETTPKSVPTTKKAKKIVKSSYPTLSQRKNNSASVESQPKSKNSSNKSKKKKVTTRSRRSNKAEDVKSRSTGPRSTTTDNATTSSRSSDESNSDTGKKKVAKTKKRNKSVGSSKDSPSTCGPPRSLRERSKK